MPVYMLRHEKRYNSISFDTELTSSGHLDAETKITENVENLNIDVIYSSPFIRTLQTIKPYCIKHNIKVNVDNSLAESLPSSYKIPDEFNDIINDEYKSLNQGFSDKLFDFDLVRQRTCIFLNSLDTMKNILLVTHLPIIIIMLNQDIKVHPGQILQLI